MPTQTYTPSATWHNTSQYQENGDTTDAPTAQDGGFKALDNIAYLTGGNTSDAVSRVQVTNSVATLKLIGSSARRDRDTCMIDGSGVVYLFDSGSSATGDDYSVVTPATGTGRWILQANAVPQSTTIKRTLYGINFTGYDVSNVGVAWSIDVSTMTLGLYHNGNYTVYGMIHDFNAGDVLSTIDFTETDESTNVTTLTAYHVTSSGTVTNLGNRTTTGTITLSPTVTWATGDTLIFSANLDASSGSGGTRARLTKVVVNGTRSYIRE